VSERARRAEERATLLEQQMREFMAASRPAQAPQPTTEKPDPFVRLMDNPADFLGETTRPLLEPIQAEVRQLREFYSQREAVREHGQDTINAAFDAIHQAALQGDPEAQAVAARVKDPRNLDPYGELVKGHKRLQAVQRVGNDPDAWFQNNLTESLKDPAFSTKVLEMIRGQAASAANPAARPSSPPVVSLPPSLTRVSGFSPAAGDDDLSDAGLYASATR